MENNEWTITISPETGGFGGFVPSWFKNTWPTFGNKNQASDMKNIDIIDPNVLTQGPAPINLTNGSETGAVTTLVSSILKTITASDVGFATGGNKVYKISSTTVTNDGTYPMTIDKAVVTGETATDIAYYQSNIYVFYNHSGSQGDIAKVDLGANTIDPDWGSTVPTGATVIESAPHYVINGFYGGDESVFFTNGRYIGRITDTTLDDQALDFFVNSQTVSLSWSEDRLIIAVNRPNITGSNFNQSGVYRWNGISPSWESDPIDVPGRIGALYTKNGMTFIWWQDGNISNGYWLGYLNGTQLGYLRRYTGTLPNQTQVGEHEGFISWISSGMVFLWGANDSDVPVNITQYGSAKYTTTIGAMGNPFGSILIASNDATTHYSLAKLSGYSVDSTYKFKVWKVSGPKYKSSIDMVQVETEQMASGAKVDMTITYNKAKSSQALTQIAYSTANNTFHRILTKGIANVEDFRLDIDFANGSASNPVKIRSIQITGHTVPNP
jgi:hypothetical protein